MQHYFYDICWNDETVLDEEGTDHFDDGSAIYYGRTVASRIARCGTGEKVCVYVRDNEGRLLSIVRPASWRPMTPAQARVHAIVEGDLLRQSVLAG